jgi:hypothetical protein
MAVLRKILTLSIDVPITLVVLVLQLRIGLLLREGHLEIATCLLFAIAVLVAAYRALHSAKARPDRAAEEPLLPGRISSRGW